VVFNNRPIRTNDVINFFGIHTSEFYSLKTVSKVASALKKNGHDVKLINGNKNVINEIQNFLSDIAKLGMVFNMAYGMQGESRYSQIPSILEMLGIPYVGSSPQVQTICQNKILTKILLKHFGILTPKHWHFSSPNASFNKVVFPVIVKPIMESSSTGIQIAVDEEKLEHSIYKINNDFKQSALVEQFIPGSEFTVSLIGNTPKVEILPIVGFDFNNDPMMIQTDKTKLKQLIRKICPAKIPIKTEQKIKRICLKIFEKLNIRDYCRVDLRIDSLGNIYILEVNSIPSLGVEGSLVLSAKTAGYSYDSFVNRIFDVATLRCLGFPTTPGITQISNEITLREVTEDKFTE